MPAQKPTQPPTGADMNALTVRVDELSQKTLGKPFTSKLSLWKRWVGGEKPEYDGTGLRDVVNANAIYLDAVKDDLDQHKNVDNLRHAALASRVSALEAQGKPPFPGSG